MFFGKNKADVDGLSAQKDLLVAYKQAFGTPQGKIVLLDLMNRYHILNGHQGDVHKEGQRSVVLEILHRVNIDLTAFDEMMRGD